MYCVFLHIVCCSIVPVTWGGGHDGTKASFLGLLLPSVL